MGTLIDKIKREVRISDLLQKLGLKPERNGFVKSIYNISENTASMKIYYDEDRYHCYGSDKGGDVIQMYEDFYRIDTKTAIKELANLFGIENNEQRGPISRDCLPKEETFQQFIEKKKKEFRINELSEDEQERFYAHLDIEVYEKDFTPESNLLITKAFETALLPLRLERLELNKQIFAELYNYCNSLPGDAPFYNYLIEQRKLNARKVMAFKIFYITDYSRINNHMKKTFTMDELQRSGLFNKKEDGSGNLIFFNHRIIIPYLHNGQIVYMRGRYFDKDNNSKPQNQSKYIGIANDALNVNHTKRFFNADVLKNMLRDERIHIVEGELDAIAGESLGYNTIAIPGASNLPKEAQLKKLMAFDIVILGDNDNAGKTLTEKLKMFYLEQGKAITIKNLPNKDLNDFLAA